jgi:PAS domain S-box-containing protein
LWTSAILRRDDSRHYRTEALEEELAAEKKRLAVTLGSIGDGVITIDLSGRIVVCNAASETMTGWAAGEAVGRLVKDVFQVSVEAERKGKDLRKPRYRSDAERILFTTADRFVLTSRDGTERLIEQVASPIRDGKNELCGVVLVFRDITEKQRADAERRKAETLEQLGLLAGGIAHDFNNLLTAVIGNISLAALLLPPNDEMIERLDDARNASLRARDLAHQLLTFSRGGAPIKKAACIASLIEETVSFSLRGSRSRSVVAITPNLWSTEFDPGQISQVIANLVVNAERAMPGGGTLHVDCDNFPCAPETAPSIPALVPRDYIRIRVRDEGVGIPEQCLKRIFDPYFTTKPSGNGLGLATTYSIVRNHNGHLTVESAQDCGSTFTVYLPATRQETALVKAAPTSNEPINGTGRILVVDDEEGIRALAELLSAVSVTKSSVLRRRQGDRALPRSADLWTTFRSRHPRSDVARRYRRERSAESVDRDRSDGDCDRLQRLRDGSQTLPLRRPGIPWCHCEALRGGRAGTNGARRYLRKPTRLRIPGRATIDVG